MTIRIPTEARNAALAAVAARADAGPTAGQLRVYSGSQPSSPDNTATGTLLATFTLTNPAFDAPSNGQITLDADPDLTATAVASGTAGWFRIVDSTGMTVIDGSVGSASTDLVVNSTSFTTGLPITLLSLTIVFPA